MDNSILDATENTVIKEVNRIIMDAFNKNASNIHFEPNSKDATVRYRIDGVLSTIQKLDSDLFGKITGRIKLMSGMSSTVENVPQDGRIRLNISGKILDWRNSVVPTINGESICMRLLTPEITSRAKLENIHLGDENLKKLKSWCASPCGMIITTGPSSSGKTTLLYMIMNEFDKESMKICTVEDPVELAVEGVTQIPVNIKNGVTFSSATRALLRQDPDVLFLGEIRDSDTLMLAVNTAVTGHILLSSIHAENAISVLFRFKNMGLEPFLIKDSIRGIIGQRLVRKLCPDCRESYTPEIEELKGNKIPAGTYYRAKGCEKCNNTGYKHRIPICELFEFSSKTTQVFMDGGSEKEVTKAAVSEGMKTIFDDAIEKAGKGLTSIEEILRVL